MPEAPRRRAAGGVIAAGLAALAFAGGALAGSPGSVDRGSHHWSRHVAAAQRFARSRGGTVSFAVIDEHRGFHGKHPFRTFDSASVIKAMLMVAYLNQPGVRHRGLNDSDRDLLRPMITRSDNATAERVYEKVGNKGLDRVAHRAGMKKFTPSSTWGLSRITARDQAWFMYRITRYIADRHVRYAMHLLKSIVPSQRWGIAQEVPPGWKIYFKDGFVPDGSTGRWKINQVALLRNPPGRKLAIVVLTRGNPTAGYGHATVRGVADRLLRHYRRDTRPRHH
jgi:beta-lactamase class A